MVISLLPANRGNSETIRLATVDWPPYYGPDYPQDGPLAEIARAALKEMGHDLSITYMPWSRALVLVREGKFDGLFGAYRNSERSRYIEFTKTPIGVAEIVFFARKEKIIRYKKLEDLKGLRIGWRQRPNIDPPSNGILTHLTAITHKTSNGYLTHR